MVYGVWRGGVRGGEGWCKGWGGWCMGYGGVV